METPAVWSAFHRPSPSSLKEAEFVALDTRLGDLAVHQHYDAAPWNVHLDGGKPVMIDWETDDLRPADCLGPPLADAAVSRDVLVLPRVRSSDPTMRKRPRCCACSPRRSTTDPRGGRSARWPSNAPPVVSASNGAPSRPLSSPCGPNERSTRIAVGRRSESRSNPGDRGRRHTYAHSQAHARHCSRHGRRGD